MTGFRWLASPLTGTVGVLTGLGFLAIPLWRLTSAKTPLAPKAAVVAVQTPEEIPAVLRLKLLAPAKRVTVETADAGKAIDLTDAPAGETEYDAVIPFRQGRAELSIRVDFGGTESAAFLTLMPDGYEDQTRYMIGSGETTETLSYEWHTH